MKPLSHHINNVRSQPHHIRKQVAFGTAFVIAALIGIVWAGASLATGTFALKESSFADASAASVAPVAVAPSAAELAASPAEADTAASEPAHIVIVDAPQPTAPAPEATVIPF